MRCFGAAGASLRRRSLHRTEVLLERGTYLAPRAVEQHTLVPVGDAKHVAHLLGRPTLAVLQTDDRALRRMQSRCSPATSSPSGVSQRVGASAQWPGQRSWSGGKKRLGSTGSSNA